MKKIIALDLDQTLLRNDKSLSEDTISTFLQLRKDYPDLVIIAATGRSRMRASDILTQIKADGIIALNGAYVEIHGKEIAKVNVDQDLAMDLIRELLAMKDTFVNVTYPNFILTNNAALVNGDGVHRYTDYTDIDPVEITKISIVTQAPEELKKIDFQHYRCKLVTSKNDPSYFAMIPQEVSKCVGLKDLCAYLNVEMKDVIAFGDDDNDLEMLQASGLAVAVANAQPTIKEAADLICGSNEEDGVAAWLKQSFHH